MYSNSIFLLIFLNFEPNYSKNISTKQTEKIAFAQESKSGSSKGILTEFLSDCPNQSDFPFFTFYSDPNEISD